MSIGRAIVAYSTRFAALTLVVATFALVLPTGPASAQGLFNFLFGRRVAPPPPPASAYVDPDPQFRGARPGAPRRSAPAYSGGRSVHYCVRLCDGRFFPIQRHANASPAQLCNSFCPASRTKIYSGSNIDRAVSADGMRYADLNTAFAFRANLVDNCTCNGRDAIGLARVAVHEDPTLRAGDIVATADGLMAYTGGRNQSAAFTPVEHYRGLSNNMRDKLSELKVEPTAAAPVSAPEPPPDNAPPSPIQDRWIQSER